MADLLHPHPVAEGDGGRAGERVGGGVGQPGDVQDAHALGVPGDGEQLLARVDPQHVGGAGGAVLDRVGRGEPGADLGRCALEVARDVVEVQPAAGTLHRRGRAGTLVGDDEDGALRAVGVLERDRVGLVGDVDRRVDDLAEDLGVRRVGGVEHQRLRQRGGVGAGAVGAEGDVVRLRAQRGGHERDHEVLHLDRTGRAADVVDGDVRLGTGGEQVGVGVVEPLAAGVDRHVVRARGHRQPADRAGAPGVGQVDDDGARVAGLEAQLGAAARGGADGAHGAVGGVAGQHPAATLPDLDVALGDLAVVDRDRLRLAGPGDVDDLQAAAQRAGQGVLALAEPHELDVRAVLRLAGVVVLQVGDVRHRHALALGRDLGRTRVGGQVTTLVGQGRWRREQRGHGGQGQGEQGGAGATRHAHTTRQAPTGHAPVGERRGPPVGVTPAGGPVHRCGR